MVDRRWQCAAMWSSNSFKQRKILIFILPFFPTLMQHSISKILHQVSLHLNRHLGIPLGWSSSSLIIFLQHYTSRMTKWATAQTQLQFPSPPRPLMPLCSSLVLPHHQTPHITQLLTIYASHDNRVSTETFEPIYTWLTK